MEHVHYIYDMDQIGELNRNWYPIKSPHVNRIFDHEELLDWKEFSEETNPGISSIDFNVVPTVCYLRSRLAGKCSNTRMTLLIHVKIQRPSSEFVDAAVLYEPLDCQWACYSFDGGDISFVKLGQTDFHVLEVMARQDYRIHQERERVWGPLKPAYSVEKSGLKGRHMLALALIGVLIISSACIAIKRCMGW